MASLSITNDEVYSNIAYVLGISRDYTNDWDTQTLADVQRIIRSGRRQFFTAFDWSFLTQHYVVNVAAPRETGTVEVVSGVVTLTGSTFPSDSATNWLLSVDGGLYGIASYDTTTQITLDDTSLDVDSGTAYALYQNRYDLPSNFGGFRSPVTRENNDVIEVVPTIPEYEMRGYNDYTSIRIDKPALYAVSQRVDETTEVVTWYLQIYPLPNQAYVLHTDIRLVPSDALDFDDSDPLIHPSFAEALQEAILAAAEVYGHDEQGVHNDRYQTLLQEAIRKDRMMKGTRRLLPKSVNSDVLHYEYKTGQVTWADEE